MGMDIFSILELFGGVGLFLYGMNLMGSSLEKLAGSGLERILEKLTTSKKKGVGALKGFGLGTGVTAIIQSSAATTIMLIGFVNAGIMKVAQATPVVFGANVGSTVTAQILRLGDLGSDNIVLQILKPSGFAPILVAIGAFILLFGKKKKPKDVAGILVGLGVLFYGMNMMEKVFEPLKESATFQQFFTSFSNPIIGVLTGLLITAIIQSSSASVGILQALSATGTVTYAIAVPIIIGQNIGKITPIVLGAIGANKKAKRVSISYIFLNIFGAIIFLAVIYGLYYTVGLPIMGQVVNRGDIANFHLLFNLLSSVCILPFVKFFDEFTKRLVKDTDENSADTELEKLDDLLLNTPAVALDQCRSIMNKMGDAILENYRLGTDMIYEYDETKFPIMEENESFIDKCETKLSQFIVRINQRRLSEEDRRIISEILNSINDFERIGDHCMSIAYIAKDKNEKQIHFSPDGHRETVTIVKAVEYTIETMMKAFQENDASLAVRIEPLSESIDKLKEIIKAHHVERLQTGDCSIEGGVSLLDLITSFERISSHCSNVALHVIKRVGGDRNFDEMHGHVNDSSSEEYQALYHYYEMKFIEPILYQKETAEVAEVEKPEELHATVTEEVDREIAEVEAKIPEESRVKAAEPAVKTPEVKKPTEKTSSKDKSVEKAASKENKEKNSQKKDKDGKKSGQAKKDNKKKK